MQARVCLAIGVALLIALTLAFWVTDWDPRGPALGYRPEIPHWRWAKSPPCVIFQRFGTWPGLALVAGAFLGLLFSFVDPKHASWRFPCLYILAVTVIGPGLLVNVV